MTIDTKALIHAKMIAEVAHPGDPEHQISRALLDAADRLAALEAELERAKQKIDDLRAICNVNGDWTLRVSRLEQQLAAAQAEARNWKRIAEDATHVEREELARVRGLCPEVIAFAHLMQRKLDMNACKDGAGWDRDGTGRRGWKNCDISFLREKLTEEVVELIVAIKEPVDRDDVADEAADVGNIAMMLADVCGALSQPAEPAQMEGE